MEAPDSFLCPIQQTIMEDPVSDPDGNTYERSAITDWLQHQEVSPLTRNSLTLEQLIPNRALRSAIEEWKKGAMSPQTPTPPPEPVAPAAPVASPAPATAPTRSPRAVAAVPQPPASAPGPARQTVEELKAAFQSECKAVDGDLCKEFAEYVSQGIMQRDDALAQLRELESAAVHEHARVQVETDRAIAEALEQQQESRTITLGELKAQFRSAFSSVDPDVCDGIAEQVGRKMMTREEAIKQLREMESIQRAQARPQPPAQPAPQPEQQPPAPAPEQRAAGERPPQPSGNSEFARLVAEQEELFKNIKNRNHAHPR
eukprot:TRINITY_DN1110_c4_g1_i1.p1 TRINITY_DN1110_c4_g1~~TRINITY_DN1110_c4_g1_i1.p1  ORF type:complete len:362 (+),score=92.25 TRINITY_DN1110_c4_g1_i1:139-1086(+)